MYLTVTVTDENGRYITGLIPDQFVVLEKKVPLKISYFDSLEKPVSLAFVLDLSSSIPAVFKNLAIDLTLEMMRSSHALSEYVIVTVNSEARLVSDWGFDEDEITKVLKEAANEKQSHQTALFDGCELALKKLESSKYLKRVMVVFSDGKDSASRMSFGKLRDALKQAAVTSYAVGWIDPNGLGFLGSEGLDELCEITGGKMFFPRTPLDMREITAQIGMELRQQYVIGFEPAVRDNKMHSINVKVVPLKTPAKATRIFVRHRKAYYGH